MKTHLNSEQFESLLSGQPSQEILPHLDECPECAGELASLREAFGNFREAATVSAEKHRRFGSTRAARRMPRMAWALAAAALFVSIGAPLAVHHHDSSMTGSANPQGPVTMSDEALLNSVQEDLSASVPDSLLPLAGASTNATDSTNSPRKNP